MPQTLTHKLIADHLAEGEMSPGAEIGLKIDQTLTQDATGTMVMLELEALGLDRVRTELSAQYVDHNLLQEDSKNPDDHRFLKSACERFGIWYSRPGNGVSHPLHQEMFGKPGQTLLGSDSHSCAAGAIGMLAMGAGGIEVAQVMAGQPFYVTMPEIWGVRLHGKLPPWVSAKDIILEMLRRYSVSGGVGRIIEYHGDALKDLSVMDRHVIANMGAELGATTSVFPSDEQVRQFMKARGREEEWTGYVADAGAEYDVNDHIDLATLEPLIALPSSPDNVRPAREVAGEEIYQAYIGSSANPGYRDFAVAAEMVRQRGVHPDVSLDINPTSRHILEDLARDGRLQMLLHAGARIHQAGCNGCIGMGQAPATDAISLRTVPRNFPGRSGTREDKVCLVSPETAAASAIRGAIADPRELGLESINVSEPAEPTINREMFQSPLEAEASRRVTLVKGPNITAIPDFDPFPDELDLPVLLKLGDNISTDEIMPAGSRVLPYRSNIPKISKFAFEALDPAYHEQALNLRGRNGESRRDGGHIIVAGSNYGQGSSREHAALAPRFLGLRIVVAKGFARIHWQNLINFGVLPLAFADREDYDLLSSGDRLLFDGLRDRLAGGNELEATRAGTSRRIALRHSLSPRQCDVVLAGGIINHVRSGRYE